jgi:ArsR family transcriptional regulator, zinc-responsive transcriptional repressor
VAKKLKLVPTDTLAQACECLRVLAHPVRLRIVDILMQGEFQVHELAALCQLPPPQTSEHLRLLQGRGLLVARREGRSVFYGIADPRLPALLGCVRSTCRAADEVHSVRRATA